MGIPKTDFMRGMQSPKILWPDKHKPGLKVIPPETHEKLDAGNAFGDLAMAMFGDYVEMTVYRPGRVSHYSELKRLQDNSYWSSFQKRLYTPEMCRDCEKRIHCDGGCREAAHVFFGDITDFDPLFLSK